MLQNAYKELPSPALSIQKVSQFFFFERFYNLPAFKFYLKANVLERLSEEKN